MGRQRLPSRVWGRSAGQAALSKVSHAHPQLEPAGSPTHAGPSPRKRPGCPTPQDGVPHLPTAGRLPWSWFPREPQLLVTSQGMSHRREPGWFREGTEALEQTGTQGKTKRDVPTREVQRVGSGPWEGGRRQNPDDEVTMVFQPAAGTPGSCVFQKEVAPSQLPPPPITLSFQSCCVFLQKL